MHHLHSHVVPDAAVHGGHGIAQELALLREQLASKREENERLKRQREEWLASFAATSASTPTRPTLPPPLRPGLAHTHLATATHVLPGPGHMDMGATPTSPPRLPNPTAATHFSPGAPPPLGQFTPQPLSEATAVAHELLAGYRRAAPHPLPPYDAPSAAAHGHVPPTVTSPRGAAAREGLMSPRLGVASALDACVRVGFAPNAAEHPRVSPNAATALSPSTPPAGQHPQRPRSPPRRAMWSDRMSPMLDAAPPPVADAPATPPRCSRNTSPTRSQRSACSHHTSGSRTSHASGQLRGASRFEPRAMPRHEYPVHGNQQQHYSVPVSPQPGTPRGQYGPNSAPPPRYGVSVDGRIVPVAEMVHDRIVVARDEGSGSADASAPCLLHSQTTMTDDSVALYTPLEGTLSVPNSAANAPPSQVSAGTGQQPGPQPHPSLSSSADGAGLCASSANTCSWVQVSAPASQGSATAVAQSDAAGARASTPASAPSAAPGRGVPSMDVAAAGGGAEPRGACVSSTATQTVRPASRGGGRAEAARGRSCSPRAPPHEERPAWVPAGAGNSAHCRAAGGRERPGSPGEGHTQRQSVSRGGGRERAPAHGAEDDRDAAVLASRYYRDDLVSPPMPGGRVHGGAASPSARATGRARHELPVKDPPTSPADDHLPQPREPAPPTITAGHVQVPAGRSQSVQEEKEAEEVGHGVLAEDRGCDAAAPAATPPPRTAARRDPTPRRDSRSISPARRRPRQLPQDGGDAPDPNAAGGVVPAPSARTSVSTQQPRAAGSAGAGSPGAGDGRARSVSPWSDPPQPQQPHAEAHAAPPPPTAGTACGAGEAPGAPPRTAVSTTPEPRRPPPRAVGAAPPPPHGQLREESPEWLDRHVQQPPARAQPTQPFEPTDAARQTWAKFVQLASQELTEDELALTSLGTIKELLRYYGFNPVECARVEVYWRLVQEANQRQAAAPKAATPGGHPAEPGSGRRGAKESPRVPWRHTSVRGQRTPTAMTKHCGGGGDARRVKRQGGRQ